MKKENLKDEKIQTNVAEEIKSEDLQKCSEQNAEEEEEEYLQYDFEEITKSDPLFNSPLISIKISFQSLFLLFHFFK